MNINGHKRHTQSLFFPRNCCWWGEEAPFGTPGTERGLSIFTIFPAKFRKRYQSHFEALGLHLFVRDAKRCSDDCANSSNPTYSRSSHNTTTHTHTHTSKASATFLSLRVPAMEFILWNSKILNQEITDGWETCVKQHR